MRTRLLQTAALLLLIAALAACRERESRPTPTPEILSAATEAGATHPAGATSAASATVTLTPRPTHTPRPTATPTITPTPTATAPPILSRGDPLSYALQAPSPQGGAPCGVIDRLDFPLDPPDALDISRGGQDFGRFRSRYDGYHAGEDWWGPGGRGGSFGEPVYAIGHGQVTFAHPYGWGIDQGTIILRHVYADGREFYSFYGHLDPPSVELSYGACVRRGEKIGEIGRPRGSPHLHFEMRLHTPGDPGPGYWSHDPRRSGWLAPSQTIWEQRIGASPGVIWLRPSSNPGLQGIGLWQDQTLVAISGPDLLGLDVGEGSTRWRQPLMEVEEAEDDDDDERLAPIAGGVFDAREPIVYTADRRGRIIAVRLPSFAGGTEEQTRGANGDPQLLWDLQLHGVRGSPDLIPLPSGGVVLAVRQRMIAFSANGAILWRGSFEAQPVDWLALADRVLVSARGAEAGVWELSAEGLQAWNVEVSGILLQSGEHLFLYDARAVYRLDPASREATVFYDLADGLASESDAIALPDGGLLLAHMDSGNRRLMALDAQGALRWERSYGEQVDGRPTLLAHGEQVFLLSEEGSGSWSRVFLHRIDPQGAEMTLLFSGGTREAIAGGVWAYSNGSGSFLLNIGGGSLVALDVPAALRVVCNEQAAPAC